MLRVGAVSIRASDQHTNIAIVYCFTSTRGQLSKDGYRSGRESLSKKISLARDSAQSLDFCDIGCISNNLGHIRLVHCGTAAVANRDTMVWQLFISNRAQTDRYRLFPFGIVTSSLTLLFLLAILILAAQRMLIPGIILVLSFILFVLWLTTLIETAVQLFGPQGNVNANCNTYVTGQQYRGVSVETLAWLTQNNICSCWKAVFSWALISTSELCVSNADRLLTLQFSFYGCKFLHGKFIMTMRTEEGVHQPKKVD